MQKEGLLERAQACTSVLCIQESDSNEGNPEAVGL